MFHGETKEFQYGSDTARWEPGSSDFNINLIYNLKIEDIGPDPSETERLVYTQMLRTLSQFPELSSVFDKKILGRGYARLMNIDASAVPDVITPVNTGIIDEAFSTDRLNGGHGPGDQGLKTNMAQVDSGMRRSG